MSQFLDISVRNESLLDQLTGLISEIEVQRPWLMCISDGQMNGKPMDAMPSLLEMNAEMARREWEDHVPAVTSQRAEVRKSDDMSMVLNRLLAGRKLVVNRLSSLTESDWDASVGDQEQTKVYQYAFQMTKSDGDFLKAIAERMHESVITFRG